MVLEGTYVYAIPGIGFFYQHGTRVPRKWIFPAGLIPDSSADYAYV